MPHNTSVQMADEQAFLTRIDDWIESELRPIAREYDRQDRYPRHILEQLKGLGLFGATIGREFGGLGLSVPAYAGIVMRISSAWMAITGLFNGHMILACALEKYGTPEQKSFWLPKLASGEEHGGLALTEPEAGTDMQAIAMTARGDGGGYAIDGRKTWVTNGAEATCFALLVKTDPEARPRHAGMSLFIAPKAPGLIVGRRLDKLGYRCIDAMELIFDDYRLSSDHLVGEVEGRGMEHILGALDLGRIAVAARGAGIAEGALRLALDYAQSRQTFGKPICEHQAIQLKLGSMAARARAAALMAFDAARVFEEGGRCDLEASMAKYFASEAALENATEGLRIHGGHGYSKDFDIERLYRDAPVTCIGEGTNEMQQIIIAKQLVRRSAEGLLWM